MKILRIDRLFFYYIPLLLGGLLNFNWDYFIFSSIFYLIFFQLFMFLNTITDIKGDIINKRKTFSFNELKNYIFLNLILLTYMLYINYIYDYFTTNTIYVISLYTILGILYHDIIRIKKYYPFNNLLLGTIVSLAFLIGLNKIEYIDLTIFIGVFFTIVSHYKDIKDIKGDMEDNINTLPIILKSKLKFYHLMGSIVFVYCFVFHYYYNKHISLLYLFIYYTFSTILFNINKIKILNKKEWYLYIIVILAFILFYDYLN